MCPTINADTIARITRGDVSAFDAVFHSYYQRLWNFAVDHGVDGDAAADIVQDVFVTFWRRHGEWRIETVDALMAYLFRATRNLVTRTHRDAATRGRLTQDAVSLGEPITMGEAPAQPDDVLTGQDLESVITALIRAMPRDRRIAVTLRLNDGLGYDEIAAILGTSPAAVRMHVTRARAALAQAAEGYR